MKTSTACGLGDRRPDRRYPDYQAPANKDASEGSTGRGVTLSGLLNVLDGFHAPENVVFIMTTNDVDALDPAILRPGRIDYRLFLGEATASQKLELYRRFFPEASDEEADSFAASHQNETMAEFQGRLLRLEQESSGPLLHTCPDPPFQGMPEHSTQRTFAHLRPLKQRLHRQ